MKTKDISVQESLDFIIDTMATKEDFVLLGVAFRGLEESVDGLGSRIDRIEQRFDGLEEKVDAISTHMDDFEEKLEGKIDEVNHRIDSSEDREREKRMQLEVRTTTIEKHLRIKPPAGTV